MDGNSEHFRALEIAYFRVLLVVKNIRPPKAAGEIFGVFFGTKMGFLRGETEKFRFFFVFKKIKILVKIFEI